MHAAVTSAADSCEFRNLVCRLSVKSTGITHVKVLQHVVHVTSQNFWEISANISETVQNRDIVTMED